MKPTPPRHATPLPKDDPYGACKAAPTCRGLAAGLGLHPPGCPTRNSSRSRSTRLPLGTPQFPILLRFFGLFRPAHLTMNAQPDHQSATARLLLAACLIMPGGPAWGQAAPPAPPPNQPAVAARPAPAPAAQAAPASPVAGQAGSAQPSGEAGAKPQPPRPAVPGAPCLIAQFRAIALDTHNPTERAVLARQWLQRNLAGCAADKLTLLGSNRSAWLGTADSAELMGLIDTAIEAQSQNDPALLRQLYDATPRTFQPTVETIRTEPPRPILQPAGAMPLPPIGMVNIRQGDRGDHGSGGTSQGGQGGGQAQTNAFSDQQRKAVSDYFSQSYEIGECPAGLIAREGRCQSQNPDKLWRVGEPFPRALENEAKDLPNVLAERLGPAPSGSRYVRAGSDVLMLDAAGNVTGAVTDFGQPPVVRRSLPRPSPAPQPAAK